MRLVALHSQMYHSYESYKERHLWEKFNSRRINNKRDELQSKRSNLLIEVEALESCHNQKNYLDFQAKHYWSWKN